LSFEINKNPDIFVDFSLINEPSIINKMLELSFNSTVYSSTKVTPIYRNITIPHTCISSKKIQIYISENVINSILYALKDINFFSVSITTESTEKFFKLDTSTLGIIISNLTETYGPDKKVNIDCSASDYPNSELTNDKFATNLSEKCSLIVRLDDGTNSTALKFYSNTNSSIKLNISDGKIIPEITSVSIKEIMILYTNIGDIDTNKLKNGLNFLIATFLPSINDYLRKGYQLPMIQGISLSDSSISLREGYLLIESNPIFQKIIKRFLSNIK